MPLKLIIYYYSYLKNQSGVLHKCSDYFDLDRRRGITLKQTNAYSAQVLPREFHLHACGKIASVLH